MASNLSPYRIGFEKGYANAQYLFFSAALIIIPIARLMSQPTELLPSYTGNAAGGSLNAAFGNAPKLIIVIVALHAG